MVQTRCTEPQNIRAQEFGKIAFVVSRFNPEICDGLLQGATKLLRECGFSDKQWDVFWVPGAFEIPLVAQKLAGQAKYSGVVALGCVIRGETPHFDFVSFAATYGVMQAGLASGSPVTFGVITVENQAQAVARSRDDEFNKGRESTLALLEVVQTLRQI